MDDADKFRSLKASYKVVGLPNQKVRVEKAALLLAEVHGKAGNNFQGLAERRVEQLGDHGDVSPRSPPVLGDRRLPIRLES